MTRYTATELRKMAEMLGDFRIETQATRDKQSDKAAEMLRQAADDAEDADRYRWLRSCSINEVGYLFTTGGPSTDEDFDAAIDTDRKENA